MLNIFSKEMNYLVDIHWHKLNSLLHFDMLNNLD